MRRFYSSLLPRPYRLWNPNNSTLYTQFLDKGNKLSSTGAMVAYSGKYMGRVPSAKRVVFDNKTKDIWWGKVNMKIEKTLFNKYLDYSKKYLYENPNYYIIDAYAGWCKDNRLKVRIYCYEPYHALFMKNMLIPANEVFEKPDFEIYNIGHKKLMDVNMDMNIPEEVQDKKLDDCLVSLDLSQNKAVIFGTGYAGEMKKSILTIMMYLMPEKGYLPMHASANINRAKDNLSIFFGLSGTGKTSLSADVNRDLIGDDEHVWYDKGVFNVEGGCYAKTIDLTREKEPEIYDAIKYGSILENVIMDDNGKVDYRDISLTQNTRCAYPLEHIPNALIPATVEKHPDNIIFLTCDAFGVLPPIARLTKDQAFKFFVLGFTSKVAGTEDGVKEPQPTFSSCFGEPFIVHHPKKYGKLLLDKLDKHGSNVWLINTGWVGGGYGKGKRIDIDYTRSMIDYIHNGDFERDEFERYSIFDLEIPKNKDGRIFVPKEYLRPIDGWENKDNYMTEIKKLYNLFEKTYRENYED